MGKELIQYTNLLILTMFVMIQGALETEAWAMTTKGHGNERKTMLQFYFHDVVSGNSPTAIQVVRAPGSNEPFKGFGFIAMIDDPLTETPDRNSKLVGRAQGISAGDSQETMSLLMALTYTFTDGIYNGSSVSILGQNSILNPVRELPVVGGTGIFRMARGFAIAQTYSFNLTSLNAIVGYNVTIFH